MKQNTLAKWMKIIIAGIALCGVVVYGFIIPAYGKSMVSAYPEFTNRYLPWLIFLLASGVPCYCVLVLGWQIASNIGRDQSFTMRNARLLKWISWLAAGDSAFFFLGNVALLLMNMSHPGVTLALLMVSFAGVAVAVAAAALSHLVQKAAALQEQSDLTI